MSRLLRILDSFPGSALSGDWTITQQDTGVTIVVGGGVLTIAIPAFSSGAPRYGAIAHNRTFDLTGATVTAKVAVASPESGLDCALALQLSSGNRIIIDTYGVNKTFAAYKEVAGVSTELGPGNTIVAWTHWRFRESGGTVYWEYSINSGSSWVTHASELVSNLFSLTALTMQLWCGDEVLPSSGNVAATFDDITWDSVLADESGVSTGSAALSIPAADTGAGADTGRRSVLTTQTGSGADSATRTLGAVADSGHGTDLADVQTSTPFIPPSAGLVPTFEEEVRVFVCGEFGKALYREMEPVTWDDPQQSFALQWFLCTIGSQFEEAWTLARDVIVDGKRIPGWSIVLDLTRIPTKGLGWLAQFVGVTLDLSLSDALQRERIRETDGWKRGSVGAFMGAARQYLTGNRTVIFKERYTSAYHILVVTRQYETPDPDAVLRALQAQKPAGLVLEYHTVNGRIYLEVKEDNVNYTAAKAAYASYEAMRATRDADVPVSTPLEPSDTLVPTGTLAPGG